MFICEQIKSMVSMRDVLEKYGYMPTRNGSYKCMYHDDKRPSASVSNGLCRFHCFACGVTKDIFDFVKDQEKCDLRTALKIIDDKFNLGLLRHLTPSERQELEIKRQEREKEKAEKKWWHDFENKVCNIILDNKKVWKDIKKDSHLTRGEYRKIMQSNSSEEWKSSEAYFMALKEIELLDWLYNTICEIDDPLCEYDYIYGTNRQDILELIKDGVIVI